MHFATNTLCVTEHLLFNWSEPTNEFRNWSNGLHFEPHAHGCLQHILLLFSIDTRKQLRLLVLLAFLFFFFFFRIFVFFSISIVNIVFILQLVFDAQRHRLNIEQSKELQSQPAINNESNCSIPVKYLSLRMFPFAVLHSIECLWNWVNIIARIGRRLVTYWQELLSWCSMGRQ